MNRREMLASAGCAVLGTIAPLGISTVVAVGPTKSISPPNSYRMAKALPVGWQEIHPRDLAVGDVFKFIDHDAADKGTHRVVKSAFLADYGEDYGEEWAMRSKPITATSIEITKADGTWAIAWTKEQNEWRAGEFAAVYSKN
jgi:hypothetical protein